MMAKKRHRLGYLKENHPTCLFLRVFGVQRRYSRLHNKAVDADPNYEPKLVTVSDDKSDKSVEAVTPPIAMKVKKSMPKVPKKKFLRKLARH